KSGFVDSTWGTLFCGTALEHPRIHETTGPDVFVAHGFKDLLNLNSLDPTRRGCWMGLPLAEETRLSPRERRRFERIAMHLASAVRLRRRIAEAGATDGDRAPWGAEAVLTPRGAVAHAVDEAKEKEARAALREAAVTLDRIRGKPRAAGDPALAELN